MLRASCQASTQGTFMDVTDDFPIIMRDVTDVKDDVTDFVRDVKNVRDVMDVRDVTDVHKVKHGFCNVYNIFRNTRNIF